MQFYSNEEKASVEMLANRIGGSWGGVFNGWSKHEILKPETKKYLVDHDRMFWQPGRPAGRSVHLLDDIERFVTFRNVLEEYPAFINITGYNTSLPNSVPTGWMDAMEAAAKDSEIDVVRGYGWRNFLKGGRRTLSHVGLLRAQSGAIYAELMDGNECGDDGARICKILYIHNTEKVSPFKVRNFVSALKKLLLDGVGYDFAYGHAADCDQPDHPHNSKRCKRFKTWGNMKLVVGDRVDSFEVSNLQRYWQTMGMELFPSPEAGPLAVGFYTDAFAERLMETAPETWQQVKEINNEWRSKPRKSPKTVVNLN
ncbi:hypothetical protein OAF52_02035 [bacterium]|nr:hypothetical protein [bacterium]